MHPAVERRRASSRRAPPPHPRAALGSAASARLVLNTAAPTTPSLPSFPYLGGASGGGGAMGALAASTSSGNWLVEDDILLKNAIEKVAAVVEEVAVETVKRILVEQGRQPMHPNLMKVVALV